MRKKSSSPVPCTCMECGVAFMRAPSLIADSGVTYCSRHCFGVMLKRDHAPVERQCAMCGQPFTVPLCRAMVARYCSQACQYRHMALAPTQPVADRFWEKVERGDGCWLWLGSTSTKDYGRFGVWDGNGKRTRVYGAHRMAWELTYGPIPTGLFVCHACDVRACCRPSHLWLGTCAENQADMAVKGRGAAPRGSASWAAKLTEHDVQSLRARHAGGRTTYRQMAKEYGVSEHTIWMAVRRLTWRHLL